MNNILREKEGKICQGKGKYKQLYGCIVGFDIS